MPLKAGVVQFSPIYGRSEDNLATLSELILQCVHQGAQLVVLPELCWTGYLWPHAQAIFPFCEPAQKGFGQDYLKTLARNLNVAICFGFPEKDGEKLFNSQALVFPDGTYFGPYRKVHLFEADTFWARPGNLGYQIWETPIGRFGSGICMDLNFLDWIHYHRVKKPDALLFSTNWLDEGASILPYWREKLKGYSGYFLAADRGGQEFGIAYRGQSAIIKNGLTLGVLDHKEDSVLVLELCLNQEVAR